MVILRFESGATINACLGNILAQTANHFYQLIFKLIAFADDLNLLCLNAVKQLFAMQICRLAPHLINKNIFAGGTDDDR